MRWIKKNTTYIPYGGQKYGIFVLLWPAFEAPRLALAYGMNGQVTVGDEGYGEVGGVGMAAEAEVTYGKKRGG